MEMSRQSTIESLLRELGPGVLGALMRRFADFPSAEDAVQEALLAAAMQWPAEGLPDNPRGWLIQVATRRMTDRLRSDKARRLREAAYVAECSDSGLPPEESIENAHNDDALILLFMCCHPVLSSGSAIALTLRAVGGLTTGEIASAFLIPEATMAQRIGRAKQRIQDSGIPFGMPTDRERAERLGSVLHVLYLMFNEGYTSSAGSELLRADLANEAIRLVRLLHQLLLDDSEVTGLLALMQLTDARRLARTGRNGELIPLAEQDRTKWNRELIAEGVALVSRALSRGAIGPYQIQAAIAALHDEAAHAAETDWPQILALYGLLRRMSQNPMIDLNYAIAAAMVKGPHAGIELLKALDSDKRIGSHYRLAAVRGHLHEMAGDPAAARAHYHAAAARTTSLPERNYLLTRAARLDERL